MIVAIVPVNAGSASGALDVAAGAVEVVVGASVVVVDGAVVVAAIVDVLVERASGAAFPGEDGLHAAVATSINVASSRARR